MSDAAETNNTAAAPTATPQGDRAPEGDQAPHGDQAPQAKPDETPRQFDRRAPRPSTHPRRVSGGMKLGSRSGPVATGWIGQRWWRLAETAAPAEQLVEGVDYARRGQTRTLTIEPGRITARVQGRMPKAYDVTITLPTFTEEQWAAVLEAVSGQARFSASLVDGQIPTDIEDVFVPEGLRLFPRDESDLAVSCSCDIDENWCKHVGCVMALVAETLDTEPLVLFRLRGMREQELADRLRDLRARSMSARSGGAALPVYVPAVSGAVDRVADDLAEAAGDFWTLGPELADLDLALTSPEIAHPLLRRLGPTPFESAKFPLAGLLATCYDLIERAQTGENEANGGADTSSPTPQQSTPPSDSPKVRAPAAFNTAGPAPTKAKAAKRARPRRSD